MFHLMQPHVLQMDVNKSSFCCIIIVQPQYSMSKKLALVHLIVIKFRLLIYQLSLIWILLYQLVVFLQMRYYPLLLYTFDAELSPVKKTGVQVIVKRLRVIVYLPKYRFQRLYHYLFKHLCHLQYHDYASVMSSMFITICQFALNNATLVVSLTSKFVPLAY